MYLMLYFKNAFRELADSNIPVFVSGFFLNSTFRLGKLVENREKNCSFKIHRSNAFTALEVEESFTHSKSYRKLLGYLRECDGSGFEANFSSSINRLLVTNEAYITYSGGLENVKSVLGLAAPNKHFKTSKEMLSQPIYDMVVYDIYF